MNEYKFDILLGILTIIVLIAFCVGSFQLQMDSLKEKYQGSDVYFPTTVDGRLFSNKENSNFR